MKREVEDIEVKDFFSGKDSALIDLSISSQIDQFAYYILL